MSDADNLSIALKALTEIRDLAVSFPGGEKAIARTALEMIGRPIKSVADDRAEMLALLRELEWEGTDLRMMAQCPSCNAAKDRGKHFADCRLDVVLARFQR